MCKKRLCCLFVGSHDVMVLGSKPATVRTNPSTGLYADLSAAMVCTHKRSRVLPLVRIVQSRSRAALLRKCSILRVAIQVQLTHASFCPNHLLLNRVDWVFFCRAAIHVLVENFAGNERTRIHNGVSVVITERNKDVTQSNAHFRSTTTGQESRNRQTEGSSPAQRFLCNYPECLCAEMCPGPRGA